MDQQNAVELKNSTPKSKAQPPKRKVFGMVQKYFAELGIVPSLADQAYPFNGKILFGSSMLSLGNCCSFAYIIYDAEAFADYTQSAYMLSFGLLVTFALIILIFNVEKLFEYMNDCNDLFNASKLKVPKKRLLEENPCTNEEKL